MLYVFNFINAGYIAQTQNFVGVVAALCLIAAIVLFIIGKKKGTKMANYSAIPFGAAIAGAIVYLPRINAISEKITLLTAKNAVYLVFILMAVYFIVMAVATAIILKTHPEAPAEKKKIQHAKKKNKKRR